jgi:predicted small secreted protein
MNQIKTILLTLVAAAFVVVTGTGCKNTAHGVGHDVERVGEKIQDKTD